MMRWTNTVETVAEIEHAGAKGQWRIGDAIIKDLKDNGDLENASQEGRPPEIGNTIFKDCAEKLAAKGIEHKGKPYGHRYLRDLFQAAFAFSRDDRNPKYSWDAHAEAGTPANLKQAVVALGKADKSVTIYNVRAIIKHWSDEAEEKRRKELERAKAKKQASKAKKAKASADKLAAKDKAAKDEFEKQRQEAQREIDEANEAIKETGSPPPFNKDLDVNTSDVGDLRRWAIYLHITAHTSMMKREAQKTLKELARIASSLTNQEQQAIADGCNEIMEILDEINTLVKRPVRRLAAIQGGRAS